MSSCPPNAQNATVYPLSRESLEPLHERESLAVCASGEKRRHGEEELVHERSLNQRPEHPRACLRQDELVPAPPESGDRSTHVNRLRTAQRKQRRCSRQPTVESTGSGICREHERAARKERMRGWDRSGRGQDGSFRVS